MRVSGSTSCGGEIQYYCQKCSFVVVFDTERMKIDEKKSLEHTESLRRLRSEALGAGSEKT